MKTNANVVLWLVCGVVMMLTGCLFFGDREFLWAGEHVGNVTQTVIGLICFVSGVVSTFKAGILQANIETISRRHG